MTVLKRIDPEEAEVLRQLDVPIYYFVPSVMFKPYKWLDGFSIGAKGLREPVWYYVRCGDTKR